MKITLSKSQWENIGKKAGWMKTAKDIQNMYFSFNENLLFEDEQDLKYQIRQGLIRPENVWIVSYDSDAINDENLIQKIHNQTWGKSVANILFYKELFKACSIRAVNYAHNTPLGPENLAVLILDESFIGEWWDFLRQNQKLYSGERDIEKEEMKYTDDQKVGEYEKSGPDALVPQY